MRGYLLLSEGRSGTNWLASIANATGLMGKSGEWLAEKRISRFQIKPELNDLLKQARTDNDRFSFKLFPKHVAAFQRDQGVDFIKEVGDRHQTTLVLLERRDKIGQAISMARAKITGQWGAHHEKKQPERYDFNLIARGYFTVNESCAFWSAYLAARNLDYAHFFYEDLVNDPKPYFSHLSEQLDVPEITDFRSKRTIQRDQISEDWRRAFLADARSKNILASLTRHSSQREMGTKQSNTPRTIGNFMRFLSGSL